MLNKCLFNDEKKNSSVHLKFAPSIRAANTGYLTPKLGLYSLLRIKCKDHLMGWGGQWSLVFIHELLKDLRNKVIM